MVVLYTAARLDDLLAPLAQAVAVTQRADPLAEVVVVCPNCATLSFVKLGIASRNRSASGLVFATLERWLDDVLPTAGRGPSGLAIEIAILHTLRDRAFLAEADVAPLRAYLEGAGTAGAARRAVQMATRLVSLFREYERTREDLVARWLDPAEAAPLGPSETWQRRVFRTVMGARCEPSTPPTELATHDRRPVHIFGYSYVAPMFVRKLSELRSCLDISMYALDEIGADAHAGPIAERWGRPRRDLYALLAQAGPVDRQRVPSVDPPATRLGSLQGLLRNGTAIAPEPIDANATIDADRDETLVLLACPSLRREVETVAEEIWRLIQKSAAIGPPLRFHDIAIVVPEGRCDAYEAAIAAVFPTAHDIPVAILDRPLVHGVRVAEAARLLLDLMGGSFTRTDLLRLLLHPHVGGAVPGFDRARWRTLIRELRVVEGRDRTDLDGTFIADDLYTWQQAMRRLALGSFLADESDRLYGDGESAPHTLPFAIGAGDREAAGGLVRLMGELLTASRALEGAERPLAVWMRGFVHVIEQLVATPHDRDREVLARLVAMLFEVGEQDERGERVPLEVARELARRAIDRVSSSFGEPLGEGVAVGALRPMRAIPFRVTFCLGLGEGEFPASATRCPFDLRDGERRLGDVSPAERDRLLFVETVLAARERLYLSYVAREATTGEVLEPCVVVRELLDLLPLGVVTRITRRPSSSRYAREAACEAIPTVACGRRGLAIRQHLDDHLTRRGLSRGQVIEGAMLAKALPEARRRAIESALAATIIPRIDPSLSRRGSLAVPISAIAKFLECPLQASARVAAGLGDLDLDDSEQDVLEPLQSDPMRRAILLRDVMTASAQPTRDLVREASVRGIAVESAYEAALRVGQLAGHQPAEPFATRQRQQDLAVLRAWQADLEGFGLAETRWRHLAIGRAREGSVGELLSPLRLEVSIARRGAPTERVTVELHGELEPVAEDLSATLRLSAREDVRLADRLRGFLAVVVLRALDIAMPREVRLVVATSREGGTRDPMRTIVPPDAEAAREWLRARLSELLGHVHTYLLPIEAVEAYRRAVREGREVSIEDEVQTRVRSGRVSSRFGPVRDFARFAPLQEDAARRAIAARFESPFVEVPA